MHEKDFRENIYSYCDNNIKEEVLSTVFNNLWIQSIQEISPKNLEILTSRIINDLVKEGVLREIPKPSNFIDIPYGMYKVLPHNGLIKDDKSKRFIENNYR